MSIIHQRSQLGIALVLMVAGCGRKLPPTMDVTEARAAVAASLDVWKEGGSPARLRERTPSVDFRDLNWDKGTSLKKYAIEKEEAAGSSVKVTVKLHLMEKSGARTSVVVYIVDAGPAIVVRPDALALE